MSYLGVMLVLWVVWVWFVVSVWNFMWTVITASDVCIIRSSPLAPRYELRWDDIVEVGAFHRPELFSGFDTAVYIVSRQSDMKKIEFVPYKVTNGYEFIDLLFQRAKHAKFVRHENYSGIPFIVEMETVEWKRDDELEERL